MIIIIIIIIIIITIATIKNYDDNYNKGQP